MAGKPKGTLGNVLRDAILASGKSANQLAKETGVPQTTLSRFLRGEDMAISKCSKVADCLGLVLSPKVGAKSKRQTP